MSLNAGKCSFSGHTIPISSGIRYVSSNGNSTLYSKAKFHSYVKQGAKPQNFSYTFLSRLFHKKGKVVSKDQMVKIKVEKIERGFSGLPQGLANQMMGRKNDDQ